MVSTFASQTLYDKFILNGADIEFGDKAVTVRLKRIGNSLVFQKLSKNLVVKPMLNLEIKNLHLKELRTPEILLIIYCENLSLFTEHSNSN
ncbi:MAG: hypothetical protein D4R64_07065 [Porphyromonadaceae bacterium]|nr:MAG: hypothetical protein D4R64_07065 [Porphyromonadaceae bacterium]